MSLFKNWFFYFGSLFTLILYLLFPGNVDWILDQPLLVAKALESNQLNRWGDLGIAGGNGTTYGPIPNFFYQILLHTTHNLLIIVLIKTIVSWGVIFASLWRLSFDLKLKKIGILIALLSPFLYFYNRSLWDNVFLIPISALFSSAVIRYCSKRTSNDFILAAVLAAILFHIHLMATLVIVPGMGILNWLMIKEKDKNLKKLILVQLLIGVICWPYLKTLLIAKTLAPYGHPQWAAIFLSPLLGLRLFGYFGFFEYFSPNFYQFFKGAGKIGIYFLILLTSIGPLYYFLGLKKLFSRTCALEKPIRIYFITVLIMTVLISFKMKLRAHPHYMNASWSIYFCVFWMAFSEGVENLKTQRLFKVYSSSMVMLILTYIAYIQLNSGDRGLHFGPTLINQIEIAKQLPKSDSLKNINIEVDNFSNFPQRLSVLAEIYGNNNLSISLRRLIYATPFPSAKIELTH